MTYMPTSVSYVLYKIFFSALSATENHIAHWALTFFMQLEYHLETRDTLKHLGSLFASPHVCPPSACVPVPLHTPSRSPAIGLVPLVPTDVFPRFPFLTHCMESLSCIFTELPRHSVTHPLVPPGRCPFALGFCWFPAPLGSSLCLQGWGFSPLLFPVALEVSVRITAELPSLHLYPGPHMGPCSFPRDSTPGGLFRNHLETYMTC